MRPDDPNNRRVGTPLVPQRPLLQTPTPKRDTTAQPAVANIARARLDSIYSGNTSTPTPQTTPVAAPEQEARAVQQSIDTASPYERTHTQQVEIQPQQWQQYHSAWQDYYQKYYERYYIGQVHHARLAIEAKASEAAQIEPNPEEPLPETLSKNEALHELRGKLIGQLQTSATKVRKSRHFMPIAAALCIMLIFLFLQYNRVLFANVEAYISPGNIDPANIIVDPSTDVAVSPDPKLIIPKINVDAPVDYNTTPDYDSQMKAMANGIAWFGIPGANSRPGQVGNTVLSGHSSSDIIDNGSYKFIFARLDQLSPGDTVYINYEGKRYTYVVTKKEVVKPTDVSKLVYATDKPVITLITCTPLGTALKRLLVTAEQVSPSPKQAAAAPDASDSKATADIPGSTPTFIQRIFGGGQQ